MKQKVKRQLELIRNEIDQIDGLLLLTLENIFKLGGKLDEKDFETVLELAVSGETVYSDKIGETLYYFIMILSNRFEKIEEIGKIKFDNEIPVLQPSRWNDVLDNISGKAVKLGLDETLIITFWNMIHKKSLELENKAN